MRKNPAKMTPEERSVLRGMFWIAMRQWALHVQLATVSREGRVATIEMSYRGYLADCGLLDCSEPVLSNQARRLYSRLPPDRGLEDLLFDRINDVERQVIPGIIRTYLEFPAFHFQLLAAVRKGKVELTEHAVDILVQEGMLDPSSDTMLPVVWRLYRKLPLGQSLEFILWKQLAP